MSTNKRDAVEKVTARIRKNQLQMGNNVTHDDIKKIVVKYQTRIDNKRG